MCGEKPRGGWGQAFFGLLLIAVGVMLLLEQQGFIEIRSLWRHWPVLLMVMGVWWIAAREVAGGVGMIILGGWFLACMYHWLGLTYRNSWPLLIASFGLQMMLKTLFPALTPKKPKSGEEIHHG